MLGGINQLILEKCAINSFFFFYRLTALIYIYIQSTYVECMPLNINLNIAYLFVYSFS